MAQRILNIVAAGVMVVVTAAAHAQQAGPGRDRIIDLRLAAGMPLAT